MGISINIPRQGGNADFGTLHVALEESSSLTRYIVADEGGKFFYSTASAGGGSGSVTNVSVVTANGFAGTVTSPTITPAITIKTTVSGLIKGDGTAISAATAGTDYISSTIGTASWAQRALTASYFSGSGFISTSSYALSASYAFSSSYAFTSSYAITASYAQNATSGAYALTASYALNAAGSSGGASYTHTQSTPSTTWTINHDLNNLYPAVTIYDGNGFVIIPKNIQSITLNQTVVTFSYPAVGYATLVVQGVTNISSSYATTSSLAFKALSLAPVPLSLNSFFTSSSAINTFYNTVYENRLLVDCSASTFFTWTASYNTQSYYFSSSLYSSASTGYAVGAGNVFTLPSGGVSGDIYLAGIGSRTGVPDLFSGWTDIDNTTSGNIISRVMYLVQTSSVVPSNPTIASATGLTIAFAMLIRNANTSSFTFTSSLSAANNGMPSFTAITSSAANTLIVGTGIINSIVSNISPPTGSSGGFTLQVSGTLGTTTNNVISGMVASKITGSTIVNPGKFQQRNTSASGSWVSVTVAFPSISGSLSLPKAVAFTNFPSSQSYEMTHLVQVEATSSILWTSSFNPSYNVTWPNNSTTYNFLTPGRTSIFKLSTINQGDNIFGQNITDSSPTTITSATTTSFTPNLNTGDVFTITAQASDLYFYNPIGTPFSNQRMIIRIKDNGTSRALNFTGSQYRASLDIPFPVSSSVSKTLYLGFIYNSTDTKWDLLAKVDNFT
jgi:hypothetical protein